MNGMAIFVAVAWCLAPIFLTGSFIGWFLGFRMGKKFSPNKTPTADLEGDRTSDSGPISVRTNPSEEWHPSDEDADTLNAILIPRYLPKAACTIEFCDLKEAVSE